MNIRSASGAPTPNTTCVRPCGQPALRARRRLGGGLGQGPGHASPAPSIGRLGRRGRARRHQELAAKARISRSTSAGRSIMATWPAPSSTTSRAVGERRPRAPPRPPAASRGRAAHHDERGHRDARKRVPQVHLHQLGEPVGPHLRGRALREAARRAPRDARGASGPNCVSRDRVPAGRRGSRARPCAAGRRARRPTPRTRAAAAAGSVIEPIAPREPGRTTSSPPGPSPATAVAEQLGPLLGQRDRGHAAHAVAHDDHAGRSGATASSTAAMSRPIARSGQVPVRRRTAPAVPPLIHQHASEVRRQIDPLLVPGGHVQAEPVDEQEHRRLADRPPRATAISCRRRTRQARGRRAAGPTMGFEVVLVPAPDDRASDGARRDRAGGDPGADHRGALRVTTRSQVARGTLAPIRVTIS